LAAIDYWFSVGSTYNYLTAMRLDEVERRTGICEGRTAIAENVIGDHICMIGHSGGPVSFDD